MELRDFFVVLIVLGVACFEAEDPKNIDDIVHSMTSVAEIERRQIERRRSWRYGLDVVMIMDTSSNIGPEYHEASKSCMKLLVDIFSNVGERTRFALVTLANTATVVSNLNDSEATLRESFKQKIDDIQNIGGETMLVSALESFYVDIYRNGSGGVFLILFILTDGNSIQQEDVKLKSFIHEIYGLEVFVLGVGQNINEKALRLIASKPVKKHVFFINEFTNIEAVERYSDWMKIAVPLNAMKEAANRFTVTRYDSHAMRNVVLMVDVSSNISPEYLTAAKYFMKQIVDIFGVVVGISSRFGLVTFADTATVILNVYVDAETLLGEVIKQKIDGVQNTVGGSNLTTAFDLFLQDMYLPVTRFGSESYDIYRLDRKWNIFVFTDGEGITKDDNVRLSSTFKDLLGPGVEIFAMGIGQSINIEAMRSIASKPADKHVFEINAFRNLTKIDGAVLKGKCLVKRGRHCGCNKRDFRVC
ncbi:uncharacterized protein LOC127838013 isoform X2 [Dreissena polymorpha]|uniref:uncharacterized protein LOC127838013 isoform X2 n=1 Tax=Dreissena polymorpha TaxID=45954 RepID=UPI0022651C3E|nr:uncharacterized protein LOC127838013 isoform X2 [Dreissena polymorpha]